MLVGLSIFLVRATPPKRRWTDIDETLHICSIQPEDVHEGDNPGLKYQGR